jgi:hypothetical protein
LVVALESLDPAHPIRQDGHLTQPGMDGLGVCIPRL